MMSRRKRLFCLWLLIMVLPGLFLFSAKGEAQTKVRFGQAGSIPAHAPFWMAIEAGLFKKNDLDVERIFIQDAVTLTRALLAGELQIGIPSPNATASAILGGADLVFVASSYDTIVGFEIWARPGTDLGNLKGRTIGVSRFGATTDLVARHLATERGLKMGQDFFPREVGRVSDLLLALVRGSVDLAVLSSPATFMAPSLALSSGIHKIFDVSDMNLKYVYSSTVTTRRFVRNNPDTARKFIKAYVEGIALFKNDKEYALKVMAKYLRLESKEILEKNYALSSKFAQKVPYVIAEGVQTVLEELSGRLPKARSANPNEFIDNRFVGELEQSGFIKQLYER